MKMPSGECHRIPLTVTRDPGQHWQVIACCLTAPGHNMNQCWLTIRGFLWHLPETNFPRNAHELKHVYGDDTFNSLAPGGLDYSLKLVNFTLFSTINILSIFCEIAIRWMPQHLTHHQSTLVQVMAWCRQATIHYLSQCWPRSLSPYDVTRPQWVKIATATPRGQWVQSLWLSDAIMSSEVLVNIGSGDGLLPDSTKPLPEPVLTHH